MTLILGLETSCDETAAAVVNDQRVVLSNVVATQHELHERYAGVVPEIASRAHLERLSPVVQEALRQADVTPQQLAAVAVGHRPGLVGSLIVGVAAAKALAWSLKVPLIGVDHVEAHLGAAFLQNSSIINHQSSIQGPALGLVVSGGHTSVYAITQPRKHDLLGRTIDDAIGEAFDKAAVILGLGYPGGPEIDKLAPQGDPTALKLPKSLLGKDSLDFSFSGLKTALLYAVRGQPVGRGKAARFERDHTALSEQVRADYAASFQRVVVDTVITKLGRATQHMAQSLIVGGGVSANTELRERLASWCDEQSVSLHLPSMDFCIDNAAMIAGLAHDLLASGEKADLDLPVIATTRV